MNEHSDNNQRKNKNIDPDMNPISHKSEDEFTSALLDGIDSTWNNTVRKWKESDHSGIHHIPEAVVSVVDIVKSINELSLNKVSHISLNRKTGEKCKDVHLYQGTDGFYIAEEIYNGKQADPTKSFLHKRVKESDCCDFLKETLDFESVNVSVDGNRINSIGDLKLLPFPPGKLLYLLEEHKIIEEKASEKLSPVGKFKGELDGEFTSFYVGVDSSGDFWQNHNGASFSKNAWMVKEGWRPIKLSELQKLKEKLGFIPSTNTEEKSNNAINLIFSRSDKNDVKQPSEKLAKDLQNGDHLAYLGKVVSVSRGSIPGEENMIFVQFAGGAVRNYPENTSLKLDSEQKKRPKMRL